VRSEIANIRAALGLWITRDPAVAATIAGDLTPFWMYTGAIREGRGWIESALERAGSLAAVPYVPLTRAGWLAFASHDFARSAELLSAAVVQARLSADDMAAGRALGQLGGTAFYLGDLDASARYLEEARALASEADDPRALSVALNNLGTLRRLQGDFAAARHYHEETLALLAESDLEANRAVALSNLAVATLKSGGRVAALTLAIDALTVANEAEHTWVAAGVLEGLAETVLALNETEDAVRLIGASESRFDALGLGPAWSEGWQVGDIKEQVLTEARRQLGEERVAALLTEGRALDLAAAIETATAVRRSAAAKSSR
jgi:tetratricopeptide (TPR) repeat protein